MKIIHALITVGTLVLSTTYVLGGSKYAPNTDYQVVHDVRYGDTSYDPPFTPTVVSEGGAPCNPSEGVCYWWMNQNGTWPDQQTSDYMFSAVNSTSGVESGYPFRNYYFQYDTRGAQQSDPNNFVRWEMSGSLYENGKELPAGTRIDVGGGNIGGDLSVAAATANGYTGSVSVQLLLYNNQTLVHSPPLVDKTLAQYTSECFPLACNLISYEVPNVAGQQPNRYTLKVTIQGGTTNWDGATRNNRYGFYLNHDRNFASGDPVTGACCTLEGNCYPSLEDDCVAAGHYFRVNTHCNHCPSFAAGDLNRNGEVDTNDLAQLRGSLGLCASDSDMDGDTDIEDLLKVISSWGNSCTP